MFHKQNSHTTGEVKITHKLESKTNKIYIFLELFLTFWWCWCRYRIAPGRKWPPDTAPSFKHISTSQSNRISKLYITDTIWMDSYIDCYIDGSCARVCGFSKFHTITALLWLAGFVQCGSFLSHCSWLPDIFCQRRQRRVEAVLQQRLHCQEVGERTVHACTHIHTCRTSSQSAPALHYSHILNISDPYRFFNALVPLVSVSRNNWYHTNELVSTIN